MKKCTQNFVWVLLFSLSILACDPDNCDGHEVDLPDGQTVCVETFDSSFAQKARIGDYFYHEKHGLIQLTEKGWVDHEQQFVNVKDQ